MSLSLGFDYRLHCDFRMLMHEDEINCEFDNIFIEQIIAGTVYPKVQRNLFVKDGPLVLGKASQIAKIYEALVNYMKQLHLM